MYLTGMHLFATTFLQESMFILFDLGTQTFMKVQCTLCQEDFALHIGALP